MDRVTHLPEPVCDEDGEPAAACDKPDGGGGWGGIWQDGEFTGHGLIGFYQQSDVGCGKGRFVGRDLMRGVKVVAGAGR